MLYIYIENNQVQGSPKELPTNWKNISNFYLLDNQQLKQNGWYPYRLVEIQLNENEIINGSNIVIEENEVVEYQTKRTKTQQELENEVEGQWLRIRRKRNKYLTETDWTQVPDSPLTNQKQTEWQVYRQSLRDITSQVDPFNISWPTPPEN